MFNCFKTGQILGKAKEGIEHVQQGVCFAHVLSVLNFNFTVSSGQIYHCFANSDLIAVAGAETVSLCGGPEIPVRLGRLDSRCNITVLCSFYNFLTILAKL